MKRPIPRLAAVDATVGAERCGPLSACSVGPLLDARPEPVRKLPPFALRMHPWLGTTLMGAKSGDCPFWHKA